MSWPILSIVVWLPILAGIAVMALGDKHTQLAKQLALGTSIVTFALSIPLWTGFNFDSAASGCADGSPHWRAVFGAKRRGSTC